MTEMKLTYHARYERADRIAQILAILGIGEKLIDFPEADKTYRLMNNGVLFIMDSKTQVVITAYVPSIKKIAAFYRSIGMEHIPPYIYNVVKKNMQNKELKKLRWMYEDQGLTNQALSCIIISRGEDNENQKRFYLQRRMGQKMANCLL